MRYLLRFSFAFAIIIVLLALVGLVLPRSYRVVRSVAIEAPPATVYPLVGDLAHWRDWSRLYAGDPEMQVRFSAATTGAGAWTEWSSPRDAGGRAEILDAQTPERMRYRMSYNGIPVDTEGDFGLVGTAGGRGTHLTWTSTGRLGWSPLARWFGLLLRRVEGTQLDEGLSALKTRAEKAEPR